jgi:hypothetical protein
MVRPGRDRLTSRVEVDETYLGAIDEGQHGRETEKKAMISPAANCFTGWRSRPSPRSRAVSVARQERAPSTTTSAPTAAPQQIVAI